MTGLPSITVIGTLTEDPSLRYTASGKAVVNFTVASNARKYDKATSTWVDGDATFTRCGAWDKLAENFAESVSRGQRVWVTGELVQRSYETKEGEKRTVFEVRVDDAGPSLKWATASVHKAARAQAAPADDGWTTVDTAEIEAPF